jgi:hypothetical protein
MNKKRFERLCSKVLVPQLIRAIRKELISIEEMLEMIGAELARQSGRVSDTPSDTHES